MTIFDEMVSVRDALVAGGVRATVDPARVQIPCVLVGLSTADAAFDSLCQGNADTEFQLVILGPQPGGTASLQAMSRMASDVLKVVQRVERARFTTYSTDVSTEWPCIEMTFRSEAQWI